MAVKDDVLSFIQMNGPVLTTEVAQKFKLNSMFAGAYLSELASTKKILVSFLKVGTSPLYYIKGQEARLLNYLKHIDPKEQEAVKNLEGSKVLQDTQLEPITRVALRNSKDFAVPLRVNLKTGPELFWKWHLTNKEEAEKLIRKSLNILTEEEEAIVKQQEAEKKILQEELQAQQQEALKRIQEEEKVKLEEELEKQRDQQRKIIEKELLKKQKLTDKHHGQLEQELQELKEKNLLLEQEKNILEHKLQTPPDLKSEEQLKLTNNHKKMKQEQDEFTIQIANFLEMNNIPVLNYEIVKPNNEIDCTVQLPTVLGPTTYFCKSKNRKRVNEGDLASALLQSQMNNVPAIFLSPGELTKNTKELLATKFKAMIVKKI